jgi:hypothetical protein
VAAFGAVVVGEAPLAARTADVAATVEEEDDAAANLPVWGSGEAEGAVSTASALEMAGALVTGAVTAALIPSATVGFCAVIAALRGWDATLVPVDAGSLAVAVVAEELTGGETMSDTTVGAGLGAGTAAWIMAACGEPTALDMARARAMAFKAEVCTSSVFERVAGCATGRETNEAMRCG